MYDNKRSGAQINAIEFSPAENGTMVYAHLTKAADQDRVKQLLTANGLTIVAQPQNTEKSIIIAYGNKTEDQLLKALSDTTGEFISHPDQKKLNPWAWRGGLSIVGQSLQLASGAFALSKTEIAEGKTKPATFDLALIWFAIPNLLANIINYTFGAQKSQDVHGLNKIKDLVKEEVNHYLPDGSRFEPSPERIHKTDYTVAAAGKESSPSILKTFLTKYSVTFGEVGLRVVGSFAMAFSPANWKVGFSELLKGNLANAYRLGRTQDTLTHISGMGMLLGKAISFFPKIPDPDNPKPKTWLDTIREKYFFKASTAVEASATGVLLYDRYKKKGLVINGKPRPEYYGLLGNGVFEMGYGARWFAPFGHKVTDMQEVNAYILDGLKKVPAEKRAEALANITMKLKEHCGDNIPPFGEVYAKLSTDFSKYHHDGILASASETAQYITLDAPPEKARPLPQSHNSMQELVANSRAGATQAL